MFCPWPHLWVLLTSALKSSSCFLFQDLRHQIPTFLLFPPHHGHLYVTSEMCACFEGDFRQVFLKLMMDLSLRGEQMSNRNCSEVTRNVVLVLSLFGNQRKPNFAWLAGFLRSSTSWFFSTCVFFPNPSGSHFFGTCS